MFICIFFLAMLSFFLYTKSYISQTPSQRKTEKQDFENMKRILLSTHKGYFTYKSHLSWLWPFLSKVQYAIYTLLHFSKPIWLNPVQDSSHHLNINKKRKLTSDWFWFWGFFRNALFAVLLKQCTARPALFRNARQAVLFCGTHNILCFLLECSAFCTFFSGTYYAPSYF